MNRIAVIGGGSWGTALALHAGRMGREVTLWVWEPELAEAIRNTRENHVFLPGYRVPETVAVTNGMEEALEGAELVLTVMPSHVCRPVAEQLQSLVRPGQVVVSATKGLEEKTHLRMSQVLTEVLGETVGSDAITVLSGPSFARELAPGHPTAAVVAGSDKAVTNRVQEALSDGIFRLYSSPDVVGVELGGAVKNVIAIATGIISGLGFGHNTVAALITRGLAELQRLALALGARKGTMSGLSGLGDLVLTCTGDLSRNRQLGLKIGQGQTLEQILAGTVMVAEGVRTTRSVLELSDEHGVEMPITREMDGVLNAGVDPREAITRLMERRLRPERE